MALALVYIGPGPALNVSFLTDIFQATPYEQWQILISQPLHWQLTKAFPIDHRLRTHLRTLITTLNFLIFLKWGPSHLDLAKEC